MCDLAFSVFAVIVIAACAGCRKEPAAAPNNDAEYERQAEQYQQQLDKGDEQIRRIDKVYDESEAQGRRLDDLLNRWEEQADRYDKILDQWEKQALPEP